MSVYALKLEDGKYYVGYSENPDKRIARHFNGNGSQWTKKYRPLSVIYCKTGTLEDELTETKKLMKEYGITNVRGACYVKIILDSHTISAIQNEFRHINNVCFKCGGNHYVNFCPEKNFSPDEFVIIEKHCERCGRSSHTEHTCRARRHVNGTMIRYRHPCDRCGRYSHQASRCFAKTNTYGEAINPLVEIGKDLSNLYSFVSEVCGSIRSKWWPESA